MLYCRADFERRQETFFLKMLLFKLIIEKVAIYKRFHCLHDRVVEVLCVSLCMHVIVPSEKQYLHLKVREENTISLPTNKAMRGGITENFFVLFSHS